LFTDVFANALETLQNKGIKRISNVKYIQSASVASLLRMNVHGVYFSMHQKAR